MRERTTKGWLKNFSGSIKIKSVRRFDALNIIFKAKVKMSVTEGLKLVKNNNLHFYACYVNNLAGMASAFHVQWYFAFESENSYYNSFTTDLFRLKRNFVVSQGVFLHSHDYVPECFLVGWCVWLSKPCVECVKTKTEIAKFASIFSSTNDGLLAASQFDWLRWKETSIIIGTCQYHARVYRSKWPNELRVDSNKTA